MAVPARDASSPDGDRPRTRDEIAIGFTLGLLVVPLVAVQIAIAVQAFVAARVGLRVGARLGARVREDAERLAGLLLVRLAIALLVMDVAG